MFWSEEKSKEAFSVPDDVVDLVFKLDCKMLPLEHAWSLSQAIHAVLDWIIEEELAGIHQIHVAESGNGWLRPEDPTNEVLHLSRRTRMMLRVPKARIDDAKQLTGKTLDIDGYSLTVGEAGIKPLSDMTILFSRYVICDAGQSEEQFLLAVAEQLKDLGIPVKKMMAGKQHTIRTPDGDLATRSIMVADLDKEHSVRLQQRGIGPGRHLGCGIFVPQKGIKPVKETS
ncbi:MAG: type I-MYXAN CRISPR-associated protein Cas6/Cmx6 [Gammaproteobacteria bacterium]|nr:type I-MYXAN CRISPR-associated protein Cas6/Cmx6 [Gammaproteobacteria bacterium]MDH5652334.1 type I-MYXAN CRISPR-associated protein Cas6/Cmx6 [Gammaproteobacteria bacterium]